MAFDEAAKRAQADRGIKWLRSKWPNPVCPICTANNWQIAAIGEIRDFSGGGLVVGGALIPVMPVVCNNCGYTLLFNALVAGVIEPPDAEASAQPESVSPNDDEVPQK